MVVIMSKGRIEARGDLYIKGGEGEAQKLIWCHQLDFELRLMALWQRRKATIAAVTVSQTSKSRLSV
jgi:hypothetical protein